MLFMKMRAENAKLMEMKRGRKKMEEMEKQVMGGNHSVKFIRE